MAHQARENQEEEDVHIPEIKIRDVGAHNLESEFKLIRECIDRHPFVAMDTEFPGTVFEPRPYNSLSHSDRYEVLKCNVDCLHLIQVGLTLSDATGNLPELGTNGTSRFIWEFNFRDFNIRRHLYSRVSIELLRSCGISIEKNQIYGVDSCDFGALLMSSGLILNDSAVKWVTFGSSYDFGYLIKILTGRLLPDSLGEFLYKVKLFFGNEVYDMKHMAGFCNGLHGRLDKIASTLQVHRVVGGGHQAGSDSLLTLQAFLRMREVYFPENGGVQHAGVIYGLGR